MARAKKMRVKFLAAMSVLVASFVLLGILYAGTTNSTIGIGKAPIKVKDRWSGRTQVREHNIDLEIEIFICDEQQENLGKTKHDLGTAKCERHCTCKRCGGPGKNTCAKDHSREKEVIISKCTRSIADIAKWLQQRILQQLRSRGVSVEKGRRIYPFRPGQRGNVVSQIQSALSNAQKDGEKDHSDFTKKQVKKGKIKVGAKGHVATCQKGQNKLSYDQTKYKVTVQVRAEVKLVKWCWVTDMATGKRVKQIVNDGESFSYKIEQRIPVGYRYEYVGRTGGWKIQSCTCCEHITRAGVSTDPTSTPLTPGPQATPSPQPDRPKAEEPKKTHHYQGPGTGLPTSGAYSSFVITPDTTVAVKADGATASFFIDEEGEKEQELEPKGDYFIGPVPRKAVIGIVTGGIITTILRTGGDGSTSAPPGINMDPYHDRTTTGPIEIGVPNIDQDKLEDYDLLAEDTLSGRVTNFGSPPLYLIDNKSGAATAVYNLEENEGLKSGSTILRFEAPNGSILDEKTTNIYGYTLGFAPARVTRGTPVTANGEVSGLQPNAPIEVTVTHDPILQVNVTTGQVDNQGPGWVRFITTPAQLNASPVDFRFDTSEGLGRQDVIMRIKPLE